MELHGSCFRFLDEKPFQGRPNINRVDAANNNPNIDLEMDDINQLMRN